MERSERAVAFAYPALVALAIAVGAATVARDHVGLDAAPFVGDWRSPVRLSLVLPLAVAVAVVAGAPVCSRRLPWPGVPIAAGATASVWAVALAVTDGWANLTAPLATRFEYEPFAAGISDAGRFLRTFTEQAPAFPVHVKGHPPGATLVPWLLDRAGLGGAGWFAALAIAAWGAAVAAALVAVRRVAGETRARQVAPALALLPGAVWAATSADAVFAAVVAGGIALAVGRHRWGTLAGGGVLGVALLLTYGAAALVLVPVVVLVHRRAWAELAALGLGLAAVLVGVALIAGFWWFDGLRVTREAYWHGVASRRSGAYLIPLGNPAALAVAIGPATVAGLLAPRHGSAAARLLLPVSALVAVTAADLSLLSKGEVERIWLPFALWIGTAAVGDRRGWLAAQAAVGLAVQGVLMSRW